jgi:phospholipid transport system substrate-binding protein
MLFGTVQAATPEQASDLIRSTTNRLLSELQQRRAEINTNTQIIYELADKIAVPHFDFERTTQLATGRHWRQANAEERQALTAEFRTLLVHTYGKALRNYSGQEIVILPMRSSDRKDRKDRVLVHTQVKMPARNTIIPIDYHMHIKNNQWKVYDIIIDGVSLVTNYRSSFAQEIRKGGISGLIRTLQDRNRN